jgi:hypothetical protein
MKKMRCLFLVLALGFGLCAQRAQAQTSEQAMTFSIICQYVTNNFDTTNLTTQIISHHFVLDTVLLNSGNIAKAMAIDFMGTTNWTKWAGATIEYEVNMATGNQGIFLRLDGKQTNVSSFFGNCFTNMFSQNVSNVFFGTNLATSLPLGGDPNDQTGTTITNANFSGNLAYLTFVSSNMSFNLFGYSQGPVVHGSGFLDHVLYERYLQEAEVVGSGTFSLNVTTNVYQIITTNGTPTNYTGVAHGTIFVGRPYFLPIGPTNGGP